MLEVLLHTLAIDAKDVFVGDGQDTAPFFVTVGQAGVVDVEDAIHKSKVVLDFLVTLNVEPLRGLTDGCFEVRHVF